MDNIHSIHNIDTLYHINTLNHINYISKDYWNNRYNNTSNNYDWYLKPKHLIKLFNNIIHPHYKIFILGCGNSLLSEELYNLGYNNNNIYNADFSDIIINKQLLKYKDYNMKWFCQDITNTTNLNKNSFNIIIDKATFDILASYNYILLSTTFKQIIRLLTYNGILIIVSINKDLLNYCDINLVHIIATNKINSNFKLIYIFILQKK